MKEFFLSIYDKLSLRKRWTAVALLLVMGLCALLALRMTYQEDISGFLPQSGKSKDYMSVFSQLGGQNKVAVIFGYREAVDEETAVEAMDYFGALLEESDSLQLIPDIQVSIDEGKIFEMMEFIWQSYPYLLTMADYERMDSLLKEPDYIAMQLERDKQQLMLPTAGVMKQGICYDPLNLFTPVMQRVQSMNISEQYELIDGHIFDKESRKGLVLFSSPYGMSESHQNQRFSQQIDSLMALTEQSYPQIKISAVGAPLIAVTNAQQIKKDSLIAVSLSVVFIFAILIYSFRRADDLFWIAMSILFGWLFALGFISLFNQGISLIVIGIGSVIIGIAVNYPLHFLDHLKHEPDRRTALKEMVQPLLIGNITTVSAFLCLLFLNADAMRDLGLFGSFTLIGTILFVLVFLPVLVSKRKNTTKTYPLYREVNYRLSTKAKQGIFLVLVVLTGIFTYYSFDTSFDSNMQHINYMTPQQRDDLGLLSTSLQRKDSTQFLYAVAEGENLQEALETNEQLLRSIAESDTLNGVKQMNGLHLFVPSLSAQQQRLTQWREFWGVHASVVDQLNREATALGFAPQAFAPFVESVQTDHEPQSVDYFEPILQLIGKNFVMQSDTCVRVVNYVQTENQQIHSVKERLAAHLPERCFAFDAEEVSSTLVTLLSNEFNYIGFICGFVVFFFLWLSFGRIELSLLSFLPLAVSWIWILGIMQLCDIQFNIVNIILATFIFGQGDDYTIFITEGLMFEYAYGKKTLASYKNSVALSAIIMFIGMGTLILAKHPAVLSLAQVALVGMFTVVVMAYYLPPLVFRWITTSKGKVRIVPLTLKRLGYSLFALLFFLVGVLLITPFSILFFSVGNKSAWKKLKFHQLLCGISRFVIYHVPGAKYTCSNKQGETFQKPAVIICNHQSHLDLMAVMSLTPKVVLLTNDWVWNNIFYGRIIHYADFFPASDGIDTNLERIGKMVEAGYSVAIFPEGTRSEDCKIHRFHQGAFHVAKSLHLDVLPLYIHGLGHVLPKKDFMLREGAMYLEVGKRIPAEEIATDGQSMNLASKMRAQYLTHYKEIQDERETLNYFVPFVRYKYMYKGYEVERRCKKWLKKLTAAEPALKATCAEASDIVVAHCGQGELPWLLSLTYPEKQIYAFEEQEDDYQLAVHTSYPPENLHFLRSREELPEGLRECVTIDLKTYPL
jgi:1-acyl-sn-glycerol-3-phosphate acyltransferase